jgi:hypothetical protein
MEEESPVIYSGASAGLGLKVDLGQLGEFEHGRSKKAEGRRKAEGEGANQVASKFASEGMRLDI